MEQIVHYNLLYLQDCSQPDVTHHHRPRSRISSYDLVKAAFEAPGPATVAVASEVFTVFHRDNDLVVNVHSKSSDHLIFKRMILYLMRF